MGGIMYSSEGEGSFVDQILFELEGSFLHQSVKKYRCFLSQRAWHEEA